MQTARPPRSFAWLCYCQGLYYFLTGLWPLVSGATFQAVTEPKADFWLAQTVGALIAVSGLSLMVAARTQTFVTPVVVLGAGQAFVLGIVDVLCVPLPRTSRAYWLDAVLEAALFVGWVLVVMCRYREKTLSQAAGGS